MSNPHLAYDELETPHDMQADCEAVTSNLSLKRVLDVPAPAFVGEAARRLAAPVLVVSEAAAKLASRLNPFD